MEISCFTSAPAEITSSKTFVLEKAPLRLQRSVAVPHLGQLLMIQTVYTLYVARESNFYHLQRRLPNLSRGSGRPLRYRRAGLSLRGRLFVYPVNDLVDGQCICTASPNAQFFKTRETYKEMNLYNV